LDRNKGDNGIVGHRMKLVDNMIVGHKLGDNVRTKKNIHFVEGHRMSIPAKLGWSTSFREDLNVTSLQTKLVIKMDPEK
jgi:hypothetical protein